MTTALSLTPAPDLHPPRCPARVDLEGAGVSDCTCGGAASARPDLHEAPSTSAIRMSIRARGASSNRSHRTPLPGWAPLGHRSCRSMSAGSSGPCPSWSNLPL